MSQITTFPTPTRLHLSLGVRDIERTVAFYEVLFGQQPTKRKPDYAKFELLDPPANVSFVQFPEAGPAPGPGHFGIQVQSRERLKQGHQRLIDAGLVSRPEEGSCCYAEQEKVWVTDPDGHEWELFLVVGDTESLANTARPTAQDTGPCCAPTPTCCE